MNKRKVLELLKPKTKMLGFSRKELAKVADVIIAALPEEIDEADEESSINQKIDEYLPLLQFTQAASDRRLSSLNNRRNTSDIDDEPEDDKDDEFDDEPITKQRKNRNSHDDFDEAPRWAKRLLKMMEQGSENSIKRRAKVEALVEDLGSMGKHYLRDFDRHSFRNDDEWEDYFADLKEEVAEYLHESANRGLDTLTRPAGAAPGRKHYRREEEMSDEEVIRLAKGE